MLTVICMGSGRRKYVTAEYKAIPEEQFDDKYKLALSKSDMPDVVTKMYIKKKKKKGKNRYACPLCG